MKEFKVNEYITLKLEDKRTHLYIKGKEFYPFACSFLLLYIANDKVYPNSTNSIDEISDVFEHQINRYNYESYQIPPETEFWGYCSNLQVWAEYEYDTYLLHRTISFPLLKKLIEEGDPIAKKVFKGEITKRFLSNNLNVQTYLLNKGYLKILNEKELNKLFQEFDFKRIKEFDIDKGEVLNWLKDLADKGFSFANKFLIRVFIYNLPLYYEEYSLDILLEMYFSTLYFLDDELIELEKVIEETYSKTQRQDKQDKEELLNTLQMVKDLRTKNLRKKNERIQGQ